VIDSTNQKVFNLKRKDAQKCGLNRRADSDSS
jgi:hypothetical protein